MWLKFSNVPFRHEGVPKRVNLLIAHVKFIVPPLEIKVASLTKKAILLLCSEESSFRKSAACYHRSLSEAVTHIVQAIKSILNKCLSVGALWTFPQ